MSITGIYSNNPGISPDRLDRPFDTCPQTTVTAENTPPSSAEGDIVSRGISLSELSPKTRAALQKIVDQGGDVQKTLQQNIETLQDDFLSRLNTTLDNAGLSSEAKLTLRLDGEEKLAVAGEHPEAGQINDLLAESPELAESFREIAAQSSLVRDIRSIRTLVTTHTGIEAYGDMSAQAASTSYQVSLKGDMSHFYFGQK